MNFGEGLSLGEEAHARKKLDEYLDNVIEHTNRANSTIAALRRLRAKLYLRNLKRRRHLKLFDIDAYTNELIDRERAVAAAAAVHNKRESDESDDVIFEFKTFKTNTYDNSSNPEIIEITRVLDRFKKDTHAYFPQARSQFLDTSPIGMVEWRNDDIKCILSPCTNKFVNELS